MPLLFLEFLGTTELLVIALVALIIFGPRKLPEIGRTIGKGMAEFKRASEDFKRTWEYEVEVERRPPAVETEAHVARGQLPAVEVEQTTSDADWTPPEPYGPASDAPEAETVARDTNYGAVTSPPVTNEPDDVAAREREDART